MDALCASASHAVSLGEGDAAKAASKVTMQLADVLARVVPELSSDQVCAGF